MKSCSLIIFFFLFSAMHCNRKGIKASNTHTCLPTAVLNVPGYTFKCACNKFNDGYKRVMKNTQEEM